MSNPNNYQNIPIKVFASSKKQRMYDQQDENKVADIIRRDILPKAKTNYHSISVKVKRNADDTPRYLVAYMSRKDTYTADVVKIDIDQTYQVQSYQDNYDDSMEVDDEDGTSATYAPVEFIAATPVPEIPTAKLAAETIHNLALKAGLNSKLLLGPDASLANYKLYLGSGLLGFVNIGHGYPGGIVLFDGTLTSSWFTGLSSKPLNPAAIYFNSCQVFNPPLQPAIMNAGARMFIGGIVSLAIGPSEEVCKCFWNKVLFQMDPMKDCLSACETKHYPSSGAHGISGDLGLFNAGHVIVFQNIDFRGHHRHIFARERNLNHPEDITLNDKISSFVVLSGTWKFYVHMNYILPTGGEYPPGAYRWVADVGVMNDQVSSLRCIRS
jgi:hypothetical protein